MPDNNHHLIGNNVLALFLGSAVAVILATVIAASRRSQRQQAKLQTGMHEELTQVPKSVVIGVALSVVVLAIGVIWYGLWRGTFERRAHGAAAVIMFVAIWFAVLVNADFKRLQPIHKWLYEKLNETPPTYTPGSRHFTFYKPWYQRLAIAMVLLAVGLTIIGAGKVSHAVFWLEVAEIVPFALFWVFQTGEGWDTGVTAPSKAQVSVGT